jgi:hypothetical protein
MIVGNDEKQNWNDAGAGVMSAHGRDTVSVVDIGTDPLAPRIVVNLPLANTIFGPPTNLAITPDEGLALVANSVNIVDEAGVLKSVPDTRLWVIDLTANPPRLIDTVTVGKQPSGMSINRAGTMALIANRADNSVSVLRITGKKVELIDTVVIGEQVAHVVFTPDGKRALAAKFPGHKIAVLDVAGEKVTYNKYDMMVGPWPYNVDVTPDGRLALTADNGNSGAADGQVDTVSVIDLELAPPRVIDKVVVGDGPRAWRSARPASSPSPCSCAAATPPRARSSTTRTAASSACGSTARRSRRPTRSKSAACPKARSSATTAAISTSATSSPRTSRSCASTAIGSSTPASASRCRAIRHRCGVEPAEGSRHPARRGLSSPRRGAFRTPSAFET